MFETVYRDVGNIAVEYVPTVYAKTSQFKNSFILYGLNKFQRLLVIHRRRCCV